MYCKCYRVLSVKAACKCIIDEVIEFIQAPGKDELSDICFGINRLFGALLNREYVKVFPFDKLHIDKINSRIQEYGCIRSKNHKSCRNITGMCGSY